MSNARDELLGNIGGVRKATGEAALQRLAPIAANNSTNKMAELLRRGLYVVAFNSIEDYLKKRVSEHFSNLPSASILDFDDLPPGLRKAAVVDAIKNGVREAGYDKPNQMQIIRSVAGAVASTDNRQQYTIHEFSLLRNGSNVSATDIGNALSSLYIDRPWDQMQAILNSVGVGAPIQDRFRTCGLKRNAAAHGGQPIEYSDLTEITDLAIPLCFAFDVIFSGGMSRIADNVPTNDGDPRIDVAGGATIRYVDKRGSRWCRLNQNKQPHRYFPTRAVAVQDSRRSLSANGVIVILGQAGEIIGWHLADQRHPHQ